VAAGSPSTKKLLFFRLFFSHYKKFAFFLVLKNAIFLDHFLVFLETSSLPDPNPIVID
jgi:hypothetical protein